MHFAPLNAPYRPEALVDSLALLAGLADVQLLPDLSELRAHLFHAAQTLGVCEHEALILSRPAQRAVRRRTRAGGRRASWFDGRTLRVLLTMRGLGFGGGLGSGLQAALMVSSIARQSDAPVEPFTQ